MDRRGFTLIPLSASESGIPLHGALELPMDKWLVIDLEATTDEGGWPVADMEIIEIGASW